MLTRLNAGADKLPQSRGDALHASFQTVVDALHRRRADTIGDGVIADYVALNWLEWHGGALRLTESGSNIYAQIQQRSRSGAP